MTQIITHRGLDPSKNNYFLESSYEAFEDQLKRGFGLEFDLQITKDKKIIISHDSNLKRISGGLNECKIKEIPANKISSLVFNGCKFATLQELLALIEQHGAPDVIHAIHLKHNTQTKEFLDIFIDTLKDVDYKKFIIFDVTLKTAQYLKSHNNKLSLAPSVAHPFDIKRYNDAVGGTLMTIETTLNHTGVFSWVWLDEWDRTDKYNQSKSLYNEQVFQKFRARGIKIALVSPELHGTSPNLLGGESHQDARTYEQLNERLQEIIKLVPDAICTDYPDLVKSYLEDREK